MIGTTRIPNDNEEIRMELENTPIMYEEIEPTLKQKQKWISQVRYLLSNIHRILMYLY